MMRWLSTLTLALLTACPADECDRNTDNRCEGNVAFRCEGTVDNAGPTTLTQVPCPEETVCTQPERGQPVCLVAPPTRCDGNRAFGTDPSCLNTDVLAVCVAVDDAFFLEGQSCAASEPGSQCGRGPNGFTCLSPEAGDGSADKAAEQIVDRLMLRSIRERTR